MTLFKLATFEKGDSEVSHGIVDCADYNGEEVGQYRPGKTGSVRGKAYPNAERRTLIADFDGPLYANYRYDFTANVETNLAIANRKKSAMLHGFCAFP